MPIYVHPALPHPAVIEAYYKDYAQSHPGILRAAWGFTVETATQGLRFVLSGVFDAYPGLKIILGHGHMGEGLPFLLWRISHGLRATMKEKTFRDIFLRAFQRPPPAQALNAADVRSNAFDATPDYRAAQFGQLRRRVMPLRPLASVARTSVGGWQADNRMSLSAEG